MIVSTKKRMIAGFILVVFVLAQVNSWVYEISIIGISADKISTIIFLMRLINMIAKLNKRKLTLSRPNAWQQ